MGKAIKRGGGLERRVCTPTLEEWGWISGRRNSKQRQGRQTADTPGRAESRAELGGAHPRNPTLNAGETHNCCSGSGIAKQYPFHPHKGRHVED